VVVLEAAGSGGSDGSGRGGQQAQHIVALRMHPTLVAQSTHINTTLRAQVAIPRDAHSAERAGKVVTPVSRQLQAGGRLPLRELEGYTKEEMMRSVNVISFYLFNAHTAQVKLRTSRAAIAGPDDAAHMTVSATDVLVDPFGRLASQGVSDSHGHCIFMEHHGSFRKTSEQWRT
jgi:hypothetical protein